MIPLNINLTVYFAPVLIALMILEFIYSKVIDKKDVYDLKDFLVSGFMSVGALIITPLLKFISAGAIFYLVYELFNPMVEGVRTNILGYQSFGWAWYMWIICQFLDDFCHYWVHRFNHTVRFMWAAHIVHHTSEHFNFGTALRVSWFAMIYKPLFYAWLPAIGFHPDMVLVCLSIEVLYQFLLHTSYCPKVKLLNNFLMTPKQHQVHHAKNTPYLDKNHGAILNVFDRIFGSWKEYDEKIDIQYGVTHSSDLNNPYAIITNEYVAIWKDLKKAKSLKQGLMYIFGPPGWSPDGSSLTVKQMQCESV